jgi:hypothetical protein
MAVACRAGLGRHRPILFRQALLPIDVDFFEVTVGIDGGKRAHPLLLGPMRIDSGNLQSMQK